MRTAGIGGLFIALFVVFAGLVSAEVGEEARDRLMEELGNEEFKTREESQALLAEWGKENVEAGIKKFYQAYREHEDPEVRARTRALLRDLVIIKQAQDGQGYLGILMEPEELRIDGGAMRSVIRITRVLDGTPASKAGLQANDRILGVDELDVKGGGNSLTEFGDYVKGCKPRTDVDLHILRNGEPKDVTVNLMRRPPDLNQRGLFFEPRGYEPLPQEDLEEMEFKEWLGKRRSEDKNGE